MVCVCVCGEEPTLDRLPLLPVSQYNPSYTNTGTWNEGYLLLSQIE